MAGFTSPRKHFTTSTSTLKMSSYVFLVLAKATPKAIGDTHGLGLLHYKKLLIIPITSITFIHTQSKVPYSRSF